jgi:hypothetical protein
MKRHRQISNADCGAACVASLLSFEDYGRHNAPILELEASRSGEIELTTEHVIERWLRSIGYSMVSIAYGAACNVGVISPDVYMVTLEHKTNRYLNHSVLAELYTVESPHEEPGFRNVSVEGKIIHDPCDIDCLKSGSLEDSPYTLGWINVIFPKSVQEPTIEVPTTPLEISKETG